MEIIKASGEKQRFNKEKLYRSLRRAGVNSKLARSVCKKVEKNIHSGASSEKILSQTASCLQEESPRLAARYNLKRAIMELGPTGFPFEKYIANILKEYGFLVEVGKIIKGHCVNHEVDVVAKKGKKIFMIECKFHNSRGIRSDIKVALYVYARFLDIKKASERISGYKHSFHQAWLVTNTRCTRMAVHYARCMGLKVVSWGYPKNESLEYLIEKKGLYPITVLPSLKKYVKERLVQEKVVLVKDLLKYSIGNLSRIAGLRPDAVRKLQEDAKQLCIYEK